MLAHAIDSAKPYGRSVTFSKRPPFDKPRNPSTPQPTCLRDVLCSPIRRRVRIFDPPLAVPTTKLRSFFTSSMWKLLKTAQDTPHF